MPQITRRQWHAVGGFDAVLHSGPMFGNDVQLHGYANQKVGSKLRCIIRVMRANGFNHELSGPAPSFPAGTPEMSQSIVSAEFRMLASNLRCTNVGGAVVVASTP